MKALIIDDEKHARENLLGLLEKHCPIVDVIGLGTGVSEGLNLIETFKPELVFLDVEMQDGTGFDLLRSLKNISFKVIFVTAHNHFALQAIKWSALDFLQKPVDIDELKVAVDRYKKTSLQADQIDLLLQEKPKREKIALPTSDGLIFLKVKEIVRLEADGCYTHFHTNNKQSVIVSRTMKEYIEMLDDKVFFRVHKSHYINLDYLQKYNNRDGGTAILENGDHIPISRNAKDDFVKRIQKGI
jgi:two-component system, LytTR family, response regulator